MADNQLRSPGFGGEHEGEEGALFANELDACFSSTCCRILNAVVSFVLPRKRGQTENMRRNGTI